MRDLRHLLAALVVAGSLYGGVAVADNGMATDPHAARVANDVSYNILSPFCPGKTLAMCPSPAAAEVRIQIQRMAGEGMTEQQIKEAVIEEHGEEFRIVEPPWTDNVGLLGVFGAGLALAVFAVVVVSRRRKGEPAPADSPEMSDGPDLDGDDSYLKELRDEYRD